MKKSVHLLCIASVMLFSGPWPGGGAWDAVGQLTGGDRAASPDGRAIKENQANEGLQVPVERLLTRLVGMAFADGGRRLMACYDGHVVITWDLLDGAELRKFGESSLAACSVAFDTKDQRVFIASQVLDEQGNVKEAKATVWDAPSGREIRTHTVAHMDGPIAVAFGPRDELLMAGVHRTTETDIVKVIAWDAGTGAERRRFQWPQHYMHALAFSQDGTRLFSAGGFFGKFRAIVWDPQRGKQVAELQPNPGIVGSAAFGPRSQHLVTGEYLGKTAFLWDAIRGTRIRKLSPPQGPRVMGCVVAFSPDGRWVFTGNDGFGEPWRACIWEVASGKSLCTFRGYGDTVLSAAFSPDGMRVVIGSDVGGTVCESETGREVARLIALGDGSDWLVTTPEGYFSGSPRARELIQWRVGDKVLPAREFEGKRYRPDLVRRRLAGLPIKE